MVKLNKLVESVKRAGQKRLVKVTGQIGQTKWPKRRVKSTGQSTGQTKTAKETGPSDWSNRLVRREAGGAHDEEQLDGEEGGEEDVEGVECAGEVPRAGLRPQLRVHLRLHHVDQEVLPREGARER